MVKISTPLLISAAVALQAAVSTFAVPIQASSVIDARGFSAALKGLYTSSSPSRSPRQSSRRKAEPGNADKAGLTEPVELHTDPNRVRVKQWRKHVTRGDLESRKTEETTTATNFRSSQVDGREQPVQRL